MHARVSELMLYLMHLCCLGITSLIHLLYLYLVVSVVVSLLRGPLAGREYVAEQGLRAIGILALNDDNNGILETAGACEGA